MEPLLRFRQVVAGYPGKPGVLQGIDLEVPSHEWILVLGPNGAGKTTLLRVAVGWLVPTHGEVWLAHRPVHRWPARQRAAMTGYLPQHQAMPFAFTVAEVVAQGGWHRGAPTGLAEVHQALETLHLASLASRALPTLSGGERQMVYFARLLAQQPRFFLLDEPTTHLDPPHKLLLWETLRTLKDQGKGGMVVTHDPVLPCHLFHRILALKEGQILWQARGFHEVSPQHFRDLFGTPLQVVQNQGFCALLPLQEVS